MTVNGFIQSNSKMTYMKVILLSKQIFLIHPQKISLKYIELLRNITQT